MEKATIAKEPPRPAAEICGRFTLSPRARPLLLPDLTLRQFVGALVREELYADAIRCMAYRLSMRQAVWWGCLCARLAGGGRLPTVEETALQSAVRWVLEPDEANRHAAKAPADAATLKTLAGCLALGVFFTGSPAPDRKPPAPARPELAVRVIAGGILQATASAPGMSAQTAQQQLLALGMQTFLGKASWA